MKTISIIKYVMFSAWLFTGLRTMATDDGLNRASVIFDRDTFQTWCPLVKNPELQERVKSKIPKRFRENYQSEWRIENGTLYLENILYNDNNKRLNLNGIFNAYLRDSQIVASWYSGNWELKGGRAVYDFLTPFCRFELEIKLNIKAGEIISQKENRNSLKMPSVHFERVFPYILNRDIAPSDDISRLIAEFIPNADGSLKSARVFKNINGFNFYLEESDTIVQEIRACAELIPDWRVLILAEEIQPLEWMLSEDNITRRYDVWRGVENLSGYSFCPDTLVENGKKYHLLEYPLEHNTQLLIRLRKHLKNAFTKENQRGYVAYWKMEDEQLFLTSIRNGRTGEEIPLSDIVPENEGEAVSATWYVGELQMRRGRPLYNNRKEKLIYNYEYEEKLSLEHGRVTNRAVYKN